jgi:tetratricopeptide (TPR) repeat protein
MRNFERQADIFVYSLFDTSKPLVSTLGKIAASSGQSADRPNWHHFSIRERIDYLLKCERDPRWIARHNSKIRNSICVFLTGILLLGAAGHFLNVGVVRPKLNAQVLLKEIEKSPGNPNLYLMLGDIYFESKDYPGVRESYEKAIELNPESTHGLNNLAWLYATCEDEHIKNPVRALELAMRAAAIEPSPHILDTLAESFFVNGRYEDAIETEKRALSLARKDRSLYKKQLEKYKTAAGY